MLDSTDYLPLFDPLLAEQRRLFILNTLRKHSAYIDWILDLGCGTGSLDGLLANSSLLSRISLVDLSEHDLKIAIRCLQPTWLDHSNLRERPLTLQVYHGNVLHKEPSMQGVHCIVFSEVIEHLYPDALQKIHQVLFEYYQPKFIIISTPNADFNPYFPTYHPGYLRDPDHKFEWTQKEFKMWCTSMAETYHYQVTFDGVGLSSHPLPSEKNITPPPPPSSSSSILYATQFAIFQNTNETILTKVTKWPISSSSFLNTSFSSNQQLPDSHPGWTLLETIQYPWFQSTTSISLLDIYHELSIALQENSTSPSSPSSSVSLAQWWSNPKIKRYFRTLPHCQLFLKDNPYIQWSNPNHPIYLIEMGELDGGQLQFKLTPPSLESNTNAIKKKKKEKRKERMKVNEK